MGYHVKAVASQARDPDRRARTRTWKLQLVTTEAGQRRAKDIPEAEYRLHGFLPSMTIDQARRQKREANAKLKATGQALKQLASIERHTGRERAHFQYLNEEEVRLFESEFLFRRLARGQISMLKRSKTLSHWHAVKDMICHLKLDPSDWERESFRFYNYVAEKQFSLAYLQKLLRVANAWGYFYCKKNGKAFLPVPYPRGMDRAFIANAFHAKRSELKKAGRLIGGASAPLLPSTLESARDKFSLKHFNWLKVTVWFGLRPAEADGLLDPERYRIEHHVKHDLKVLWVYQPKLVALAPDDRWKAIPCLYPAQRNALKAIQQGKLKRPLTKTVQMHLGPTYTLYAGRKGFEDLMHVHKGKPLEVVAEWLGHQSIEMTWRRYRKKKRVRI